MIKIILISITLSSLFAATLSQSCTNYVIKAGDTLWNLANFYGTSVERIWALNQNVNPLDLTIGFK